MRAFVKMPVQFAWMVEVLLMVLAVCASIACLIWMVVDGVHKHEEATGVVRHQHKP